MKLILNKKGVALLQIMIGMGITMIMAFALSSVMINQNKQIKHLEQKSEILDLKNEISLSLSNINVCGCNLNPARLAPSGTHSAIEFNTSPINSISLPLGLRHNCLSSTTPFVQINKTLPSGVTVSNIEIVNLTQNPLVATEWNARLEVNFTNGAILQHKKISLPLKATTSATAPFSIDSCSVANSVDQEASCTALGGSIVNGQCILNSTSTCQSLGGVFTDGSCKLPTKTPTTTADCSSLLGSGWTYSNNKCTPPTSPPPTSTNDCVSTYGAGWSYSGGTCMPPMIGTCNYYENSHGGIADYSSGPGWVLKKAPTGSTKLFQPSGLGIGTAKACQDGRWICLTNCGGSDG